MEALVLGPTGATGKELLRVLLTRPGSRWARVTTVHRRVVELPEDLQPQAGRLQQVVSPDLASAMESDERVVAAFARADCVFCALGTTRKAVGSADAFRAVDLDLVASAARAAAAAGHARLFSLVSSQGADAGRWAADVTLAHPLLYAQTKGRAEEAVKAAGVPLASIFRPGLLGRAGAGEERLVESLMAKVLPKLPVTLLAEAMVRDAEARLADSGAAPRADTTPATEVVYHYGNKHIQQMAEAEPAAGAAAAAVGE